MTTFQTIEPEPTVPEVGLDQGDSSAQERMDPQAAAELAQELTLVARAMFAQLLPSTAVNAIAGVRRVGAPMLVEQLLLATPSAQELHSSEPVATSASIPLPAVPVTSVPVMATVPEAPVAPVPVAPTSGAPEAMVPREREQQEVLTHSAPIDDEEAEDSTDTPPKPRSTMAMLNEINFLD